MWKILLKDSELVSFAGLYYMWTSKDGSQTIPSFTIITTDNNETGGAIHNGKPRMPVILTPEYFDWWLDPENQNTRAIKESGVFEPYPDDGMYRYPVSQKVNNVRNNGPELVEEVDEWQW